MRITKVVAVNSQTKQKETFVFGDASTGAPVLSRNLFDYVNFCFVGESDIPMFVEVSFLCGEAEYSFSRLRGADGTSSTMLKTSGSAPLRGAEAEDFLRNALLVDLKSVTKESCVSKKAVDDFDGNLSEFSKLRSFLNVKKDIADCVDEIRVKTDAATQKVREFSKTSAENVTKSQLNNTVAELLNLTEQTEKSVAELTDATAENKKSAQKAVENLAEKISGKMSVTQHISDFSVAVEHDGNGEGDVANIGGEDVAYGFQRLVAREKLQPLLNSADDLKSQTEAIEQQIVECEKEVEWKKQEYDHICLEYDAKKAQFDTLRDKKFRVEGINSELTLISQLYRQNQKLAELLKNLEEKKRQLSDERADALLRISEAEKQFEDMKPALEKTIPSASMGDILEAARLDVKIDETENQLNKLQNEINLNESRIAEKESGLALQKKRFRSVVELDAAVSPIKAKDTILQVLNAKFTKLQTINASLDQKQRNLTRALEDFKYKISQTEQSRDKLIAERNKALLRKQEEFKREVFVNSQKVFTDDASSVFAVSANFRDAEIADLENRIAERNAERDSLLKRAASLEGAVKEIKRNIDINSAEMDALNNEKSNINNRYNEIVAENSSETVFNYLKALHSDGGTKYLLDVQQSAVSSEAEVTELKKYTDMLKQKEANLRSRLKNLRETKIGLGEQPASADIIASANDKLQNSLADVGEKMTLCYEKFVAAVKEIEEIDIKAESVNSALAEAKKTVKVNESQIKSAYDRAKKYAESDDLQKALTEFGYELSDVESELHVLEESKKSIEGQMFDLRLKTEKTKWLLESKSREYERLNALLSAFEETRETPADEPSASAAVDVESDALGVDRNSESTKAELAEDDANGSDIGGALSALREQKKLTCVLREELRKFSQADVAKMQATAAAAELNTLKQLRRMSLNFNIVTLFVSDKISAELKIVSQVASELAEKQIVLSEQNGFVRVGCDGENFEFKNLPQRAKAAIYVALSLVENGSDVEQTIVFEEGILPESNLAEALSRTAGVNFAVQHTTASV